MGERMKLFHFFAVSALAFSNLDGLREDKSQANAILSRERRGIKKTIGKVAAVGGALYVGKKLAKGIEVNEEDDGPGFFGPRVYSQEPIMDEEKIQEMEEIREEPEEEREGPFNLFGWLRG